MASCSKCGKEIPEGAAFCPACGAAAAEAPSGPAAPSTPETGFNVLVKDEKAQKYWLWRIVAVVVDYVLILVVLGLLLGGGAPLAFVFGGIALIWGIVFVLYFTVAETVFGASLGKRILNLKVKKAQAESKPTFGESLVRNISKIYWLVLLLDVIVGLAVSKGYEQKYSDRLMGTTVVHA